MGQYETEISLKCGKFPSKGDIMSISFVMGENMSTFCSSYNRLEDWISVPMLKLNE